MKIKYRPINVTAFQRENLEKHYRFLCEHVYMYDLGFDMSGFSNGNFFSKDLKEICNTVACSLGYAPLHIPIMDSDYTFDMYKLKPFFDYLKYGNRVFCNPNRNLWGYVFGEDWTDLDNTVLGAARRIRFALDVGVPSIISRYKNAYSLIEDYENHPCSLVEEVIVRKKNT